MNAESLARAAEALERSGVRFYRATSTDGANLARWEPVPWETVLGRTIAATGWVVHEDQPETAERPELRIER